MLLPCGNFTGHGFPIRGPAVQALARQNTDLEFGQMPISAFGGDRRACFKTSFIDVNLVAGTLVDKFAWHFPLLPAPDAGRERGHRQPKVVEWPGQPGDLAAGARVRGVMPLGSGKLRHRHGRDACAGRARPRQAGEDETMLLLAGARRLSMAVNGFGKARNSGDSPRFCQDRFLSLLYRSCRRRRPVQRRLS